MASKRCSWCATPSTAGRLTRIINTHLHSDHCGGNALLSRELGATITIPPGHAEAVERWDDAALGFSACGQACDRFNFDAVVRPGERLMMGGAEWQAFASPGHDPHSIVLWNADDRTLISADALWEHGFGAIFPEVEGESGFAEQRAILELIGEMKPRLVIPGHGAPFTEVDQALARAFARLDALEASPERNARSVIKTLLKFHLLIVRDVALDESNPTLRRMALRAHYQRALFSIAVFAVHCAQRRGARGRWRAAVAQRRCRQSR